MTPSKTKKFLKSPRFFKSSWYDADNFKSVRLYLHVERFLKFLTGFQIDPFFDDIQLVAFFEFSQFPRLSNEHSVVRCYAEI